MQQKEHRLALDLATALAIAALFVLLLVTAVRAQAQAQSQTQTNDTLYAFGSGAEDFQRHCAACHAVDARGNGPVAPMLMRRPPDLTLLSARNDGDFPDDRVFWIIDGRGEVKAHGPREMPVWGYEFSPATTGLSLAPEAEARIRRIVDYLKTLQRDTD